MSQMGLVMIVCCKLTGWLGINEVFFVVMKKEGNAQKKCLKRNGRKDGRNSRTRGFKEAEFV